MNNNESNVDKLLVELTDSIVLKDLTKVYEGHPLFESYQKRQDKPASTRVKLSILNAILTQRRRYFILTRDGISELLEKDFNWIDKTGLNTRKYSLVLKELMDGFIKRIKEGKGRSPSIYEVKSEWLLSLINLTKDEAMKQFDTTFETVEKLKKL